MQLLCLAYRQPFSDHALAFAHTLAKQAGATVHLLYVAKREKGRAKGQAALEAAKTQFGKTKVAAELQVGDPLNHLETAIEAAGIHYLVVGSLAGMNILGGQKVAALRRLVAQAPISTFVVREAPTALKRVLICTGGLKAAEAVIETGAGLAKALKAQATLLYVASAVPSMYTGLAGVQEELHQLLETDTPVAQCLRNGAEILDKHGVKGEVELRHGVAAEQILREADKGYDLIVLGASKSSRRIVLGDVTNEVVGGASNPVLIVK